VLRGFGMEFHSTSLLRSFSPKITTLSILLITCRITTYQTQMCVELAHLCDEPRVVQGDDHYTIMCGSVSCTPPAHPTCLLLPGPAATQVLPMRVASLKQEFYLLSCSVPCTIVHVTTPDSPEVLRTHSARMKSLLLWSHPRRCSAVRAQCGQVM